MSLAPAAAASSVRASVAKLERNPKTQKQLTAAEKVKVAVIAKAVADMTAAQQAAKEADRALRTLRREVKLAADEKQAAELAAVEAETAKQRKLRKKQARKLRRLEMRTTAPLPQDAPAAQATKEALVDSLQRLAPAVNPLLLDPVLFAEAELQRVAASSAAVVVTRREKERNRSKLEAAHAKLVDEKREQWLVEARMQWIKAERDTRLALDADDLKQHAAKIAEAEEEERKEEKEPSSHPPLPRPAPTMEEAVCAITAEMAAKQVTLERILGMEADKGQMTEKERRQAMRAHAEQAAEFEAKQKEHQAEELAKMPESVRRLHLAQQDKLLRLQIKWHKDNVNHEQRRAQRVAMFDQMIRSRSKLFHEHALWLVHNGAPVTDREGNLVPQLDPETKQPVIDEATGKRVPMRHEAGQKVYIEFAVPPESFTEYAFEWLPAKDARVYTEAQAIAQLEAHERLVDDPTLSPFQRAQREEAVVLLRQLVGYLADCDPSTSFVYKLSVQCDGIRPGTGSGHALGPRMMYALSTCGASEQSNKKRIAARGPLQRFAKVCAFCDGFVLVADELLKFCGTCGATKGGKHHPPHFCSKQCKQSHVVREHADSQQAKRKRQKDSAKAAKQRRKEEDARRAVIRNARSEHRGDRQVEAMDTGVGYGFATPVGFFEDDWLAEK